MSLVKGTRNRNVEAEDPSVVEANPGMKTCARCGAKNSDNAAACWKCYSPLKAVVAHQNRLVSEPRQEKKPLAPKENVATAKTQRSNRRVTEEARGNSRSFPKIVAPVIILLLVAGIGFAVWNFSFRPTPQKAAREFFEAVYEGKYAAAAQMITAESQAILPIEDSADNTAAQVLTDFLPKLSKVTFNSGTITDTSAVLKASGINADPEQGKSGTDATENVYLLKENGAWKVDLVKVFRDQLKDTPRKTLVDIRPTMAMGGKRTAGMVKLIDEAIESK